MDAIDLLKTRKSVSTSFLGPAGTRRGATQRNPDHRLACARSRQARALAVHRLRGRRAGEGERGARGAVQGEESGRRREEARRGAEAFGAGAGGDRGGEPGRAACEDSGIRAAPRRGKCRDDPRSCRSRARLHRPVGDGMDRVRPRCRQDPRPPAWRTLRRLHPHRHVDGALSATGRGRISPTSSRGGKGRAKPCSGRVST